MYGEISIPSSLKLKLKKVFYKFLCFLPIKKDPLFVFKIQFEDHLILKANVIQPFVELRKKIEINTPGSFVANKLSRDHFDKSFFIFP